MGIKIISEYKDPRFLQGSPSEHKLSVLWSAGGLCCHITDASNLVSLAWKEWAAGMDKDLSEQFRHEPLLSETGYGSACLAIGSGPAALAPARLFDPARAADYWQSLSALPAGRHVRADLLTALDVYVVYPVFDLAEQAFSSGRSHARIIHFATAWLSGIHQQATQETGPALFVHTSGNLLLVAAFEGRALRFFNTFSFQTAQDFLYFVLLALDQAQFALEQTPLRISGKMTADSEIHLLLQRYFVDMQFLSPAAAGNYPAGLPDERRHWYFDIACVGSM